MQRGLDDGSPGIIARSPVALDLVHQDDRIADDHPHQAIRPRIATNPKGDPVTSNAATTPISPRGATETTRKSRWKICSWIIRTMSISITMSGTLARSEALLVTLFSTVPPPTIEACGGKLSRISAISGARRVYTVGASSPGTVPA
jgi:hypothetical protein